MKTRAKRPLKIPLKVRGIGRSSAHPDGNEYHSIADDDDGQPVTWRIKIQEGKDRPKDAMGKWAFPSKFEGKNDKGRKFTKTSTLMCEMTEPLHSTRKIVSMDSGFCVTAGILSISICTTWVCTGRR